jgi:hypothetical protein
MSASSTFDGRTITKKTYNTFDHLLRSQQDWPHSRKLSQSQSPPQGRLSPSSSCTFRLIPAQVPRVTEKLTLQVQRRKKSFFVKQKSQHWRQLLMMIPCENPLKRHAHQQRIKWSLLSSTSAGFEENSITLSPEQIQIRENSFWH